MRFFRWWKRLPSQVLIDEVTVGRVRACVWSLPRQGGKWIVTLEHVNTGPVNVVLEEKGIPIRELGNACVALDLLHEWHVTLMMQKPTKESALRLVLSRTANDADD